MLKRVVNPEKGVINFGYDPLGRRIYKEAKQKRTCRLWDGNVPLHEWAETEREPLIDIITWVFEDGTFVPTARITDRGSESIVTDYLGTPNVMFDGDGNKTWEADLDIYGRVRTFVGRSLSECPFRYQGQYEDSETGLYYNRFRYYDPDSGNYLSQDPIGLNGGNNLYGYVKDVNSWIDELGLSSNSITFTDSSGLTLQVSGYTNLSHMSDEQLSALYHANNNALNGKGFGLSGIDKQGNTIVLHHYKQNPSGPIIAIPAKHHDKPHTNPGQHPFGKKKGGGLTPDERVAFNRWKQEYWKNQAETELNARGKGVSGH
jgi:RHS repeat-associated protein